jgi:crotonobetainyl-CoA:carnitine CoA-transferase CaiB-like acyl-CoA transferase
MQLGLSALYRLYEAADGWLCVAALSETHWQSLLAALGLRTLTIDPRFADSTARTVHRGALEAILEPHFHTYPVRELFELLDGRGVPCEIADSEFCLRVFDDPEMQAHNLVVHQHHPKLGEFDHFGETIHFSDTPGRIWGPPPVCGQHTRAILLECGYEDAAIDKLVETNAVFVELWVDD